MNTITTTERDMIEVIWTKSNTAILPPESDDVEFCSDLSVQPRVFAISPNFCSMFSLGPIALGHSLIVPRSPAYSMGSALNSSNLLEEFESFREVVEATLGRVFKLPLCRFEHGNASGVRSICAVLQGHLHIVPASPRHAVDRLRKDAFPWVDVNDISACIGPAAAKQDYLYFESGPTKMLAYVKDSAEIPSQYLRRIVADELQNPKWDWRKWPELGCIENARKLLYEDSVFQMSEKVALLDEDPNSIWLNSELVVIND